MNCPNCSGPLVTVLYEGVTIQACPTCAGHWLDSAELDEIVHRRDVKFSEGERRALAAAKPIQGVLLTDAQQHLGCPKCGKTMEPINYGDDTGLIIHRCKECRGLWLDGGELEKIQMLVEGWDDMLPEDLRQYGPKLRDVAAHEDQMEEIQFSHSPLCRYINFLTNRIIDVEDIFHAL